MKEQSDLDIGLDNYAADEEFNRRLAEGLEQVWAHRPEIVLYQAGADPFEDDQLGSLKLTFAHSMPPAPSVKSRTGKPPAGDMTSRRNGAASKAGTRAMYHRTIKIPVIEVDHGNDTATAIGSPPAIGDGQR